MIPHPAHGRPLAPRRLRGMLSTGHAIVCGLDHLGLRTVDELRTARRDGRGHRRLRQGRGAPRRAGVRLVVGDHRLARVLREAGAATASVIVLTGDDDLGNLNTALAAAEINPSIRVVIRMFDQELGRPHPGALPGRGRPVVVGGRRARVRLGRHRRRDRVAVPAGWQGRSRRGRRPTRHAGSGASPSPGSAPTDQSRSSRRRRPRRTRPPAHRRGRPGRRGRDSDRVGGRRAPARPPGPGSPASSRTSGRGSPHPNAGSSGSAAILLGLALGVGDLLRRRGRTRRRSTPSRTPSRCSPAPRLPTDIDVGGRERPRCGSTRSC